MVKKQNLVEGVLSTLVEGQKELTSVVVEGYSQNT